MSARPVALPSPPEPHFLFRLLLPHPPRRLQKIHLPDDAVLSLACGAGVQAVADVFPDAIILPALNTTFLGETKEAGLWIENCRGCGDCKLGTFAAVCPVTRCAKGLFNGPCGGSKGGKCEVDPDAPCAWQLIVDRLDKRGCLETLQKVEPPADWSRQQGKGPRKIRREDQSI